jgi:hypothetical protein
MMSQAHEPAPIEPVMKWSAIPILWLLLLSTAAGAEPGRLALPDFSALAPQATDSVSITLDASLLSVAARFLDSNDPEDATVRGMIGELKGIYVKSYTFDKDFAYPAGGIDTVRRQLTAPGWQRIVEVHSGKQRTGVDIFIFQVESKTRGLAIIATEPRQFTIVNIVGPIDLNKLRRLEGRFGIPKVDLPAAGTH